MNIKPFIAQLPLLEKIIDAQHFFDVSKEEYNKFVQLGYFKSTDQMLFFIYTISDNDSPLKISKGIVCLTDIEAFTTNTIKKHEQTLNAQENIQQQLLMERSAAIKPILITMKQGKNFQQLLSKVQNEATFLLSAQHNNTSHTLYAVSEMRYQRELKLYFEKKIPIAYIADGHHRAYMTAQFLKENPHYHQGVLTAYFDFSQLRIGAFHRHVSDLNGQNNTTFLAKIDAFTTVKPLKQIQLPRKKGEMVLILNNQAFSLIWRKEILEKLPKDKVVLDTHLLSDFILKPILGITNLKTDLRLKYLEGNMPLVDVVKDYTASGALFLMHPLSFKDFKTVVDSNGILPPKSTFFEPRLINGLVCQTFE